VEYVEDTQKSVREVKEAVVEALAGAEEHSIIVIEN
jgi:hypothetical protein